MNLTTEQKIIVEKIVSDVKKGKKIVRLSGSAGTGKTLVVKALSQILSNYAVVAFTGKAASVLRKRGVNRAATIHSTIYEPVEIDGEICFNLKEPHKLEWNGFLVDELSLVSQELLDDLLYFNLPLICVGDDNQLEPVGEKNNLHGKTDYELKTIHRNAGEIAHFAHWLLAGKNPSDFPSEGKIQIARPRDITDEHLLATDQIICAFNKFRVSTNGRIRRALKRTKLLEEGERVICLRNNRKKGIYNGMHGFAYNIEGNLFDFVSEEGRILDLDYEPKQFNHEKGSVPCDPETNLFDYGYVVTCHKCQGDQANNTVVYEQHCDKWDMRRWQYTAASRAINSVIWVRGWH